MSVIDICNEALVKNHHMDKIPFDADLTNPVGKAQIVCATFYNDARREALRLGPWTCIIKRAMLATAEWEASTEVAVGDMIAVGFSVFECTVAGTTGAVEFVWPGYGTVTDNTVTWSFMYTTLGERPAVNFTGLSYSSPLPDDYIFAKEVTDISGNPVHFEIERGVLYTNTEQPVLVYVPDEEDDIFYDSLLKAVIVMQTASAIAYSMTGSHENEVAFAQAAQGMAAAAFKKTKQERKQGKPPSDEWIPGIFQTRYNP